MGYPPQFHTTTISHKTKLRAKWHVHREIMTWILSVRIQYFSVYNVVEKCIPRNVYWDIALSIKLSCIVIKLLPNINATSQPVPLSLKKHWILSIAFVIKCLQSRIGWHHKWMIHWNFPFSYEIVQYSNGMVLCEIIPQIHFVGWVMI